MPPLWSCRTHTCDISVAIIVWYFWPWPMDSISSRNCFLSSISCRTVWQQQKEVQQTSFKMTNPDVRGMLFPQLKETGRPRLTVCSQLADHGWPRLTVAGYPKLPCKFQMADCDWLWLTMAVPGRPVWPTLADLCDQPWLTCVTNPGWPAGPTLADLCDQPWLTCMTNPDLHDQPWLIMNGRPNSCSTTGMAYQVILSLSLTYGVRLRYKWCSTWVRHQPLPVLKN